MDTTPPPANAKGAIEAGEKMRSLPEGFTENPHRYKSRSPTRVPEIMPKFPEPYYTFSATFAY